MHTLVGAGAAEGAVDAANILKPALARGELQCIGATTLDEYRKYIERDAALERRFQPVMVDEPTIEETVEILKGIRERYEQHHKVDDHRRGRPGRGRAVARYIPDRFLPDKAIDLIDEAASRVRMRHALRAARPARGPEGAGAHRRRRRTRPIDASSTTRPPTCASPRATARRTRRPAARRVAGPGRREQPTVDEEDIAEVVAMWTGIPVTRIAQEETARLLQMEEALHKRVVGQEEAIGIVSKAVRRARAGLKDPKRPIGTFIFLAPPASARPSWPRRWPSSCSAAKTR